MDRSAQYVNEAANMERHNAILARVAHWESMITEGEVDSERGSAGHNIESCPAFPPNMTRISMVSGYLSYYMIRDL